MQFKSLEVNVLPSQRKKFADAKSRRRVKKYQRPFSKRKLAEKQLQFFEFQDLRLALSSRFDARA
jgi:hypothetical protein